MHPLPNTSPCGGLSNAPAPASHSAPPPPGCLTDDDAEYATPPHTPLRGVSAGGGGTQPRAAAVQQQRHNGDVGRFAAAAAAGPPQLHPLHAHQQHNQGHQGHHHHYAPAYCPQPGRHRTSFGGDGMDGGGSGYGGDEFGAARLPVGGLQSLPEFNYHLAMVSVAACPVNVQSACVHVQPVGSGRHAAGPTCCCRCCTCTPAPTHITQAADTGDRGLAERLWDEMSSSGVAPDISTLNALLR